MNDELKLQLRDYYKEISSSLRCTKKENEKLLCEIKNDVEDFVENNPGADFEAVVNVFGTPLEIAESAVSDASPKTGVKGILKLIAAAVIIALFFYIAFIVISLIDVHTEAHGYFSEGILNIYNVIIGGINI